MVAKALPLAIILFFFFPRIEGDFGFIPSFDKSNSDSALSDSLVAGDIAASAFNNELAFRVEFTSKNIPTRSQMYWRAKTMPTELDFVWEVVKPSALEMSQAKERTSNTNLSSENWLYEILHEKSKDLYLPHLDYAAGSSTGHILSDYSVYLSRPKSGAFSYKGSSSADSNKPFSAPKNRDALLALQTRPNAKIQLLLNQWGQNASSDLQVVERVYKYFQDNSFEYSLTPPELDEKDRLGDFLLNTRVGYCEHYASAFTILMRMLGIPSRVVVGYQGGTSVNTGNFIEVRYSDAHAWSEVWVDDRWLRVDATATVSPERINFGMDAFMELWSSGRLGGDDSGLALSNLLNPTGISRVLKNIQDSWKTASYQWNKWVVNYDADTQRQLLEKFGVEHRNSVVALVAIMFIGALTLLILYFWQLIPKSVKRSELQLQYLRFVKQFKRFKIEKASNETPKEFAAKASLSFPEQAAEIDDITQTYHRLRYSNISDTSSPTLNDFKRQIKQFRIKRKAT